jgi:hypothetical protein
MKKGAKALFLTLMLVFSVSLLVSVAGASEEFVLETGGKLVFDDGTIEVIEGVPFAGPVPILPSSKDPFRLPSVGPEGSVQPEAADPILLWNSFIVAGGYVTNGAKLGSTISHYFWVGSSKVGSAKATITLINASTGAKVTKAFTLKFTKAGQTLSVKYDYKPTAKAVYNYQILVLFPGITKAALNNWNYNWYFIY